MSRQGGKNIDQLPSSESLPRIYAAIFGGTALEFAESSNETELKINNQTIRKGGTPHAAPLSLSPRLNGAVFGKEWRQVRPRRPRQLHGRRKQLQPVVNNCKPSALARDADSRHSEALDALGFAGEEVLQHTWRPLTHPVTFHFNFILTVQNQNEPFTRSNQVECTQVPTPLHERLYLTPPPRRCSSSLT